MDFCPDEILRFRFGMAVGEQQVERIGRMDAPEIVVGVPVPSCMIAARCGRDVPDQEKVGKAGHSFQVDIALVRVSSVGDRPVATGRIPLKTAFEIFRIGVFGNPHLGNGPAVSAVRGARTVFRGRLRIAGRTEADRIRGIHISCKYQPAGPAEPEAGGIKHHHCIIVVIGILGNAQRRLLHVADAGDGFGFLSRRVQCRQKQRGKDGNNRNDHQQFYQ